MAMPTSAAYSSPGQVSSANAAAICAWFDIGSSGGATSRSSRACMAGHENSSTDHPTNATSSDTTISTDVRVRRTVTNGASRE